VLSDGDGNPRFWITNDGHLVNQDGNTGGYGQTSGNGGFAYTKDTGSIGGSLILTNNANRGWAPAYINKIDWASGKDDRMIAFYNGGGFIGTISHTASSVAYNTSSDYRLKENVVGLTGAADRVQQLAPKRFNFIVDADKTVDGFLAHEVADIVPEAISGEKDAVDDDGNIKPQAIDQSKLVPLLTAALQEALTKIDALETRIVALEAN
jgi:hypothetical protein